MNKNRILIRTREGINNFFSRKREAMKKNDKNDIVEFNRDDCSKRNNSD